MAVTAGLQVTYEPATERLATAGYGLEKYPCYGGVNPYDLGELFEDPGSRSRLVERVVSAHPDVVTTVTAPHFYVAGLDTAHLNVALAEETWLSQHKPVRAVVTIANKVAKSYAAVIAGEYADAGIRAVELRLSPLGGDDEGLAKLREAFAVLDAFRAAGLHVTLRQSGTIGHLAVALGHADDYSVGVGMLEQVNHSSVVWRQKQPPKPREDDDTGGGPTAGVYLGGLEATTRRKTAAQLLENTSIRTRIGCRIDACGESIRGPLVDVRTHYLHSRASAMAEMLRVPAPWRATAQLERLKGAIDLRRRVNQHYLSPEVNELKLRTLRSLVDDVEAQRQAS